MALSEEKVRAYTKRLLLSRMRLLCTHGFFGLLLMHMAYAIDEEAETAYTDGVRIAFSPQFLDELSDSELDFVMMHEVLHVALSHCFRCGDRERERFNIACDIVVNSNLLAEHKGNIQSITLRKYGPAMHTAPDGVEGAEYTAEQVYEMLLANHTPSGRARQGQRAGGGKKADQSGQGTDWDDHTHWNEAEDDGALKDMWDAWVREVCASISVRDPTNSRGLIPGFAERLLKELRTPQTDWRAILNDFVQEEITDYSFTPPDKRFEDSPFFLPDFNEKESVVKNILFMVDTSASMTDDMVTAAYSEIKGAIDQFDGKLKGWLGFFDAAVIEPRPFESEAEFRVIRPQGGGGTNFHAIFSYVGRNMSDEPPASIIVLTDGEAPFPKESAAMGIPVLWLLNNENVDPPWGKIARITL